MTKNLRLAGGKTYLSFEPGEVKNRVRLDFELSEDVAASLKTFCELHRPRLAGADGPYLFPGKYGDPKSGQALRSGMSEALRKRSGLFMHPHLFRHTVAKIVVERNPDLYVAVSQLLGHKGLNMTLQKYLGTESRASARHIDRVLKSARLDPALKTD